VSNRIAILADYAEENWLSMDLCASRLLAHLPSSLHGELIQPSMKKRASPILARKGQIHIVDRLLNRQWDYPRYVRRHVSKQYDFFHIVDHSYANLALMTPSERTGIYCHDLDAFQCLTQSEVERRPWWFRKMSRRVLSGLQTASIIFYSTKAVHADMLRFQLFDPARLIHAPYGVDEAFSIVPPDAKTPDELKCLSDGPWLLHVGATIPRKRIDILLQVFAAARERFPSLRLCKLGSAWTVEQESQIRRDDLQRSILHLGKVSPSLLVDTYRRASAVVVTSDAEGFGLPLIEAMACGAPVIASDIPVLRESGGSGAIYAPVGNIDAWVASIARVIAGDATVPSRDQRLAWAAQFSWFEHAKIIANAYLKLQ